jgi:hypothetical protein
MEGRDDIKRIRARERGIFERPNGSGIWWVRYADENGRIHREKVGTKSLAFKVYQKRKTEVKERRFFPERFERRREITVAEMIDDFLGRIRGHRSYRDYARNARVWKEALKGKALRQVLPGDVERYVAARREAVRPATINRELAFIKRVFSVAIADGYIDADPAQRVKLLKENNVRTRFLPTEEEVRLRAAIGEEH